MLCEDCVLTLFHYVVLNVLCALANIVLREEGEVLCEDCDAGRPGSLY